MREKVPGSVGGFAGAVGRTTFGPLQPSSMAEIKNTSQTGFLMAGMGTFYDPVLAIEAGFAPGGRDE